jgi:serine/threonine protein kinase
MFKVFGPLDPEKDHFVGRVQELTQMRKWVKLAETYGLVLGASQTGKTSLLLKLQADLQSKYACVYLNLQTFSDLDQGQVYQHLGEKIVEKLHDRLEKKEWPQADYGLAFIRFLKQLSGSIPSFRIVLLLDEMDALSQQSLGSLANTIRGIFHQKMEEHELRKFVFIYAAKTDVLTLADRRVSPLRNITECLYLEDLSRSETFQLLEHGFAQEGIQIEETIADHIYGWTHGHPYLTQALGDMLLKMNQQKSDFHLTKTSVDRAVQLLHRKGDSNLRHVVNALQRTRSESPTLLEKVRDILESRGKIHFSRTDPEILQLELMGIVREGEDGYCTIRNHICRHILGEETGRGNKVGRYKIVEELGSGAMSIVYKARDPNISRLVALKVIRPGSDIQSGELKERFRREAKSAGRLKHPKIVAVHDAGEDRNVPFIVMEYLEGPTLAQVIRTESPLALERVIGIVGQIGDALDHAHQQGVVHRDIKPSNIFVLENDQVKVADFGLAKLTSVSDLTQEQALGTFGYTSPEQLRGQKIDGRTDIFSLGIVIYEMLTGKKPFERKDVHFVISRTADEKPLTFAALSPDIPPDVEKVLLKATAKDVNERYQTCAELTQHLKDAQLSLESAISERLPPSSIYRLATFIHTRREAGDQPYILLLGSSLSLTLEVRHAVCGSDGWEAFWTEMQQLSDVECSALMAVLFAGLNLAPCYHCLAGLIQAGYFNIILTANIDDALDNALRVLPASECKVLCHGQTPAQEVASALSRSKPRVRAVKLHGDINTYKLLLTPENQFEFPAELEKTVKRLLSQDTILVGDIPFETDIQRCIRKGDGALWVVVPEEPQPGSFLYNAKQARPKGEIITGPKAEFEPFFRTLANALASQSHTPNNPNISIRV